MTARRAFKLIRSYGTAAKAELYAKQLRARFRGKTFIVTTNPQDPFRFAVASEHWTFYPNKPDELTLAYVTR